MSKTDEDVIASKVACFLSVFSVIFVVIMEMSLSVELLCAGVSREVDNLIQENNELLATKYITSLCFL